MRIPHFLAPSLRSPRYLLTSSLFAPLALAALLAFTPATALAQAVDGVTVVGYGEATAPAETASIQLLITRGEFFGGPPPAPRPGVTPGEEERELLVPIVEAITAEGVAQGDIGVVVSPVPEVFGYGPGGPAVGRIDLAIAQPTDEGLTSFLAAVSFAAADQRLTLGQVGVLYEAADCAALEREAREAAIADARQRAEVQAELLGVQIGPVTASADMPVASSALDYFSGLPVPSNSCAPPTAAGAPAAPGLRVTLPSLDPAAEPEVEVYAQVSLTFAIAEG